MRCVASDQHSSAPPDVGRAGAERVDGVALERRRRGRHVPGREQLPRHCRIIQLGDRLVREPHELPAPPAGTAGYQRGRARRVAELPVEGIPDAALVRQHVHHEPVEGEALVRPAGAEGAAHEAVRAVTAHDEARGERDVSAVSARCDLDVLAAIREGVDLAAPPQRDVRERAGARLERRFEQRLMAHVRVGPAREAGALLSAEAQQDFARRVAPFVDPRRLGEAVESAGDAHRLEDAPHLVVEVHGARKRVVLAPALEHDHAAPALREQDREAEARRAGADDGDVEALARRRAHAGRSPRASATMSSGARNWRGHGRPPGREAVHGQRGRHAPGLLVDDHIEVARVLGEVARRVAQIPEVVRADRMATEAPRVAARVGGDHGGGGRADGVDVVHLPRRVVEEGERARLDQEVVVVRRAAHEGCAQAGDLVAHAKAEAVHKEAARGRHVRGREHRMGEPAWPRARLRDRGRARVPPRHAAGAVGRELRPRALCYARLHREDGAHAGDGLHGAERARRALAGNVELRQRGAHAPEVVLVVDADRERQ